MLRGQRVLLRPHRRADLTVLQPILRDDVATVAVMEDAGWLPRSLERAEARFDKRLADDPPTEEIWLVVQAHDDPVEEAIGEAGLWGIDLHRRQAHLGVVLARTRRGSGLGRDVVRVLCDYAFRLRGLHRLQVDTLKLNTPMRAAATAAGFQQEGVLREAGWYDGEFVDSVTLGLLAHEWFGSPAERQHSSVAADGPDVQPPEARP